MSNHKGIKDDGFGEWLERLYGDAKSRFIHRGPNEYPTGNAELDKEFIYRRYRLSSVG